MTTGSSGAAVGICGHPFQSPSGRTGYVPLKCNEPDFQKEKYPAVKQLYASLILGRKV